MDANFWSVIGEARAKRDQGGRDFYASLVSVLQKRPAKNIEVFAVDFARAKTGLRNERMLAAADLILGGVTDDSYDDFLNWVISQGRTRYYRVAKDPDSLAERFAIETEPQAWQIEALTGAIYLAYEKKTGRELVVDLPESNEEVAASGTRIEQGVYRSLPKLLATQKKLNKEAIATLGRR